MIKSYEKHMICIYLSMNNLSLNNLSVFFFFAPNRVLLLLITNCNITDWVTDYWILLYLFIPLLLLGAAWINLNAALLNVVYSK